MRSSEWSSKRHSSTPSATSEYREKLVPAPSYVAPSGNGRPGHTRRVLAMDFRFGIAPACPAAWAAERSRLTPPAGRGRPGHHPRRGHPQELASSIGRRTDEAVGRHDALDHVRQDRAATAARTAGWRPSLDRPGCATCGRHRPGAAGCGNRAPSGPRRAACANSRVAEGEASGGGGLHRPDHDRGVSRSCPSRGPPPPAPARAGYASRSPAVRRRRARASATALHPVRTVHVVGRGRPPTTRPSRRSSRSSGGRRSCLPGSPQPPPPQPPPRPGWATSCSEDRPGAGSGPRRGRPRPGRSVVGEQARPSPPFTGARRTMSSRRPRPLRVESFRGRGTVAHKAIELERPLAG